MARNDLWVGHAVRPRSVTTSTSYAWTLLDKPPGSAATITNATSQACAFTPDIAGSYRVLLTIGGGGLGNSQILVAACTRNSSGVLVNNGWRIPAVGELPVETNFGGTNDRGWDEAVRSMFNDIEAFLAVSGTVQYGGVLVGQRNKLNFIGAGFSVADNPGNGSIDVTNAGLTLKDEGVSLGAFTSIDAVGAGVTITDLGGGHAQLSVLGLTVEDEGVSLGTFPTMNFVGGGVTATNAGAGVLQVSIPGMTVKDEGTSLGSAFTALNFIGAAVTAVDAGGGQANVTVGVDVPPAYIVMAAGMWSTPNPYFTKVGGASLDMANFPATMNGKTRTVTFVADVQKTAGATSVEVELVDETHAATLIATTDMTYAADANPSRLETAGLTVGAVAGNIRNDVVTQYGVYLKMNGGGVSDSVFLYNAKLKITYT